MSNQLIGKRTTIANPSLTLRQQTGYVEPPPAVLYERNLGPSAQEVEVALRGEHSRNDDHRLRRIDIREKQDANYQASNSPTKE
jgi:hypothetical protein